MQHRKRQRKKDDSGKNEVDEDVEEDQQRKEVESKREMKKHEERTQIVFARWWPCLQAPLSTQIARALNWLDILKIRIEYECLGSNIEYQSTNAPPVIQL